MVTHKLNRYLKRNSSKEKNMFDYDLFKYRVRLEILKLRMSHLENFIKLTHFGFFEIFYERTSY